MVMWMDMPMQLHAYREYMCMQPTQELCDYEQGYWRFWYESDHRFALPTIAFFLTVIILFTIARFTSLLSSPRSRPSNISRRAVAVARFLSYRSFHVRPVRWYSPSAGVLLLGIVGFIYFACMVLGPRPYYWPTLPDSNFGSSPPLATRSGWLAMGCMPFVFATASKANMISTLTGISHERLQVFHRWISYTFFILALLHTIPFIVHFEDTGEMTMQFNMTVFYWTGIIALIAQGWLTFASLSPLRRISYEFFKISHFVAAAVFMLFLFFHCDHTLSVWDYFIGTAAIYVPCWLYSRIKTYFEYGLRRNAIVSVCADQFTRLSVPIKLRYWRPGQHCFLQIMDGSLHALTSHPFTICSLPPTSPKEEAELVFYIRCQGSLTAKLYNDATTRPSTAVPVLVNGPYGGVNTKMYHNADRLLVIAGGSGAGWTLPLIEYFVRRAQREALAQAASLPEKEANVFVTEAAAQATSLIGSQSLRVIFATRDAATRIWYRDAVSQLLSTYPIDTLSDRMRIDIYLTTGATSHSSTDDTADHMLYPSNISTSSSSSQSGKVLSLHDFSHRPNLSAVIADEAQAAGAARQSLGIFGCGPSSMQYDISSAAAKVNIDIVRGKSNVAGVYMHQEHFSW